MNQHSKIVLNTAVSYTRTVLGAVLAIFSSKWILNGLGQNDYGIFVLVGSVIVFVTFLNSVMAGSVSRHFAIEIGKGVNGDVQKWFNTALSAHIILPLVLIMLGFPIAEYCIKNVFEINPDRLNSALWVFRISMLSAFVNMVSIPFIGMYTAYQKIAELSVVYIISSVFLFIFAYTISYYDGDRLIYYAMGYVGINLLFQLVQIFRAYNLFPACKIHFDYWWNRQRFKEILSFAGWNLIGSTGALLRNQGSAILLNLYFGTTVNAAYGIANQVSTQVSSLTVALNNAISPEITTNEGRGDRAKMIKLSLLASKFASLLLLIFCIPIIIDMDYVLVLWLKTPPEFSAIICRLMLIMAMIDNLTIGNSIAVNATGKIAKYQAVLGTTLLMTLPISWMFLASGFPPSYVGVAAIITMTGCSLGRIFFASKIVGIKPSLWIKDVLVKYLLITSILIFIEYCIYYFMLPSIFRLLTLGFVNFLLLAGLSWLIALTKFEKDIFISIVKKIIKR